MTKANSIRFFLSIAMTFLCSHSWAETGDLYERYSKSSEVKVHVSTPKETDPKGVIDTEAFKKALEKALVERKSIHFKVVEKASEATLSIEVDIQGFYFSEHDPVDMLMGVGMAAMDAAKQDHFARLEGVYRVLDAKDGRVLWKEALIASLTDEKMTEAESKIKILDRASDVFIKTAFGRKKRTR